MRLADADVSRSMLDLGYQPHVTLAVYDTLRADVAIAALDRVFENVDQIAVTLTDVTTFGGGSGVLYAALDYHGFDASQAMTAAAIDEVCRPHYQTGSWTPHCTLATGVNDADRSKMNCDREWHAVTVVFEASTLWKFSPFAVIKRWALVRPAHSTRTL